MARITPTDLLAWSVLNKATEGEDAPAAAPSVANAEPIDPKWIELILGKPDSARMKDIMETVGNSQKLEEKISLLDEFEMLVESADNANDLQPLKLWPVLMNLLKDTESDIRKYAAWIMGTAIQNNEKGQADFQRNNGLIVTLDALKSEQNHDVQMKLLYCISGAIRSSSANFESFVEMDGINILANHCKDGNELIIKRTLFLLTALLQDEETTAQTSKEIQNTGLVEMVLDLHKSQDINIDHAEQSLRFLNAIIASGVTIGKDTIHATLESLQEKLASFAPEDIDEIMSIMNRIRAL